MNRFTEIYTRIQMVPITNQFHLPLLPLHGLLCPPQLPLQGERSGFQLEAIIIHFLEQYL